MGEFEEETYSTVFTALRHPVRRRILRTLSQGSQTFTDLQSAFKVNNAVLTYHLDAMKDLICKTEDGKYSLSTMGEGAMALMERVEEPPKVTQTTPSHKNSRPLSILQSATICIAIILLVSGTYLTSISSVQEFYDVPADLSSLTYFCDTKDITATDLDDAPAGWVVGSEFKEIDGNFYDNSYSVLCNWPNQLYDQLTETHEGDIYVNLKTNETAPSGLYRGTLTYLDQEPFEHVYYQKQWTYRGDFQPVESSSEIAFSTHLTLPYAYETLAYDLRIDIWTNATHLRTSKPATESTEWVPDYFLSVKASATKEFYSETRPYESQGNIITTIGIILVAAALIMHIPPLLRKQT